MCGDPPAGEGPCGLPPPGGLSDGGHGTWTPVEWDMGISTHWDSADDSGNIIDQGVYCSSSEHGYTIHWNFYYHGLVYSGGAEDGDAALADMVGADRSRYPRYKNSMRSIVHEGRYWDGEVRGRERLGYWKVEGGRTTRWTREDHLDTWQGIN